MISNKYLEKIAKHLSQHYLTTALHLFCSTIRQMLDYEERQFNKMSAF